MYDVLGLDGEIMKMMKEEYEKLENQKEKDNVNHPSHYADKKIEVIDYMEDTLTDEEFIGYCIGNVIKYTSRWRKKNGKEDLQKALWYLKRAISKL